MRGVTAPDDISAEGRTSQEPIHLITSLFISLLLLINDIESFIILSNDRSFSINIIEIPLLLF